MPPRNEEVRTALEMVPINIIRNIIDERDISFTSRKSSELIERLLQDGWTDEQFEELKHRLAKIELERQPYSRYVSELNHISSGLDDIPEHERVEQVLLNEESDFDDDNKLVEPGFEISEANGDVVKGIHWTESINYSLTPRNEIKKQQTLYETGFEINFENDAVFVDCTRTAKASGLLSKFDSLGIETTSVGHSEFSNLRANDLVQEFVDDLNERLVEKHSQRTVGVDDPLVLEIDLVNLLLDEANLKDVKIGGRTDIMENDEVRRFRDEHDSRIVRLEGEFLLDGKWYSFKSGYTDSMGQVSVEKKGKVEERPDLVQEAFDFLFESYEDYFVDI
ncbi:hypothetical protein [Halorubrum salinum]|uniref:hypothetical protein n=1 Tax=Halorubrum salinum TaxID=767517 RepID=UPI00211211D1|nr:hypothetical protein [Halorubrum salinum]